MDKPIGTLDETRSWSLARTLPLEQDRIWEALTDREAMRHWSELELVGERSLGAPITIVPRDGSEPRNGSITAFARPRRFAWVAEGRQTAWEVVPTEGGCAVALTETLEGDVPGPRDDAEWEARRRELEREFDALERYLADGSSVTDDPRRPYLAVRGV